MNMVRIGGHPNGRKVYACLAPLEYRDAQYLSCGMIASMAPP